MEAKQMYCINSLTIDGKVNAPLPHNPNFLSPTFYLVIKLVTIIKSPYNWNYFF